MGHIEDFIARYTREYDFYDQAAKLVAQSLESSFQAAGIRSIVTYRAKSPIRLEEKVRKRAAGQNPLTIDHFYEDIVDLAGTRVALYFPGERQQVEKIIEQIFIVREPRKEFPGDSKPARYKKRFTGYGAVHYRVQLREESLGSAQKRYADARVEIQIASVLMHAWSEVEHDLVYKPLQGDLSQEEYWILDELNGLVMAGEIALERLQAAGEFRVAGGGRPFHNHYDLASFLINKTSHWINAAMREAALGRVDQLFELLRQISLATPDALKPYIDALHNDVERRPIAAQIIDALLSEDPKRYDLFKEISASNTQSLENGSEENVELHKAMGRFLDAWISLEKLGVSLFRKTNHSRLFGHRFVEFLSKEKFIDQEETMQIERFRRMRNNLVHGIERPNPIDLSEAAKALHEIVDSIKERAKERGYDPAELVAS
jgi:ppGpp synthetase/RelA/SpoT-type nucleotidyltranferase